ncbi:MULTISPECIES: helicase [unclassified Prochlorococcus]|nr:MULTISPECIES: helicase [unclassified Prochlorococcus]KGG14670.1 hypothetical protein EV06_1730 [Prochlorococcus sp. MIT 0602]KGG15900.1 hypothetical protein EV07_1867 [Prochlorococcus sp. MIT 0603]
MARSLRRRDKSIFQFEIANQYDYWLGVLIPLALKSCGAVLVVTPTQRRRLFEVEIPRLRTVGLNLPVWEGKEPPIDDKVWVLDYLDWISAYRHGFFRSKQLIILEAERFSSRLREAMSIKVNSSDWTSLSRAYPSASSSLINLHDRLSLKFFSEAIRPNALIRVDIKDILELRDLLGIFPQPPELWSAVLDATSQGWASWAELDHKLLDWTWHLQPLEPLQTLRQLFIDNSFIMLNGALHAEFESFKEILDVNVKLGGPIHQEPVKLFVPFRQPLPNAECFGEHLLDQCRRLVLGRQGLTVLLLDDNQLLRQLTSQLAAEFGKRVSLQSANPSSNGVICCNSEWWLAFADKLPPPEQLIIALLPISSLESPLTAARVESYKKQGLDWFRDLLLPDLLRLLPVLVLPIRQNNGRIAILDGRLRSRSWGNKVFYALEPWIPVNHLLPD